MDFIIVRVFPLWYLKKPYPVDLSIMIVFIFIVILTYFFSGTELR